MQKQSGWLLVFYWCHLSKGEDDVAVVDSNLCHCFHPLDSALK